jgi:hypothetical protein
VEFAKMPPPYFIVSRLAHLESHTESSKAGMRPDIEADVDASPWRMSTDIPEMGFLRDRWPRFITTAQGFNLNVEYRIYEDTVYQVCTYKKKRPEAPGNPPLPRQTIIIKPTFRRLDFSRNDQDLTHEYVKEINKKENVLRIWEKAKGKNTIVQTTTCLCLSLFINGHAQEFSFSGNQEAIQYTIDSSGWSKLEKTGELEMALAYTLRQIPLGKKNVNDIQPVDYTKSWRAVEESGAEFKAPSFTKDAHLNFALRRNLEHILSVCSIPVAEPPSATESSAAAESSTAAAACEKVPLIAFTCGDISGHRISTAASL